jgi:hypothetical protein
MWIFNQNKTMFIKCDTVFIRQSMNNKDLYEIRGRRAGREGSDVLGVYERVKAHNVMAQFVDKYKPDMLWIMPKE